MKKVVTDDKSIDEAEAKLGFSYPKILREKLKIKNGFYLAGFRIYGVLDQEDVQHTFDDIVRENTNSSSGWQQYIPSNYVAIGDDEGIGCLVLNTNKDGIVYYWNNQDQKMETYATNETELEKKLSEAEAEIQKIYQEG